MKYRYIDFAEISEKEKRNLILNNLLGSKTEKELNGFSFLLLIFGSLFFCLFIKILSYL